MTIVIYQHTAEGNSSIQFLFVYSRQEQKKRQRTLVQFMETLENFNHES